MAKKKTANLPAPASAPMVAFRHNGVDVLFDEKRLINLTAMWKAAGSDSSKTPVEWKRYAGASFIKHRASVEKVGVSHLFRVERGRNGSTWAHWQIALAYAKYISDEFHSLANEAFKEWAEEKANPGLKMERAVKGYLNQGKDGEWVIERVEGIVQRNSFTHALADHNCKRVGTDNPFAEATRSISLAAIGQTPSEFKASQGLKPSARTRDHLTKVQLTRIRFAESEAEELVKTEAADGNVECMDVVRRASHAVKLAIESLKRKAM